MMDDVLHDLFLYHVARHAEAEFTPEMPELARRLGMRYRVGPDSLATPERVVYVRADASAPQRRSEAAHEISHLLTAEAQPGDPSYEEIIRWYHASVPDMQAHLEVLADHGADRLLMPEALVGAILGHCGYSGRAVWELARFADVPTEDALRRLVYFDESVKIGGFISHGGFIQSAFSKRWRLPFWLGDRVPEPHILVDEGVSLFAVPHKSRQLIGVITVGEFDAA
ncbi:ImmA/IrrE family metallo-endopeptidase [Deinococcus sp. Arct2-2]|uniref:ImmA/IrrE family metallo-endopeptidase n=1 Tax=Deinococcus sp. Arct2-2 TaxID=2568653 RepID=UPI0010A35597|nr:ImmA/IrrE family metallo-endopeptidase [Deinococcus sp. Arct2-2]THF69986.1 ImmA/IrrE family metallo-endopeptidase [Deinococcus sp. Arct2-2]